ncbi:MerR family transcriptional regulator [Streptomyces albireticuli]|uniref:MerR family transcriptional regulator n=1 Tax=Streptomyces albireticuli TaxID=1940 RepID=A0A1Z2L3Y4_9ACTN|nr:MerR family transcriptional regulator [Streptomyces albireticuli]
MKQQRPARAGGPGETGPAGSAGGTSRRAGEYRIEDLAHRSGATVRTIRAYQDRGLLPKAERRGRANVYRDTHLARLRQISGLLDRGYTLASIKELLEAWDAGRGLGGVLGLVTEVDGPWSDETAERITRAELDRRFGGEQDDAAVDDAVELGVLVRLPDTRDAFLVPSPRELSVAVELHKAGVPLLAISGHLRELRTQVEYIAGRFLDFTTEHIFHQYFDHPRATRRPRRPPHWSAGYGRWPSRPWTRNSPAPCGRWPRAICATTWAPRSRPGALRRRVDPRHGRNPRQPRP